VQIIVKELIDIFSIFPLSFTNLTAKRKIEEIPLSLWRKLELVPFLDIIISVEDFQIPLMKCFHK
jgi:hypothetical protein